MATIRELGFCSLNSRDDFNAIRRFFDDEKFDDPYLAQELELTEIMLPPLEAKELKELRIRLTQDYDVRRAAMFLKLLRFSYSSSGKSFASQPFDIRKLFGLIYGRLQSMVQAGGSDLSDRILADEPVVPGPADLPGSYAPGTWHYAGGE